MSDDLAPTTKFRSLTGAPAKLARLLLCALTLLGALWALEIHDAFSWTFFKEQYLGLFFALVLASIFINVKARASDTDDVIPWHDWLLAIAGLTVGGYITVMYPIIAYRLGVLSPERWILGGIAILLILEATRRVVGWALVWITVPIILYAKFAYLFPGILNANGSSWQRLVTYLYLDSSGIFGLPLDVAASVIVAFIFFGQALYAVGGDKFLTDIALVLMGRFRGGTAKVAVVSSTLFGTVSGSAVANVVVDGAITIPMMKKSGYPPHVAAAIEAVASNGGQIMPPVMGVAAFLMAEFLNISYGEVALAAAIPACLYYVALFTQIDLEAAKLGLVGMPESEIPRLRDVIKRGWVFLVPLAVLVYTLMFAFWEPGKAGMAAVIATFLVGALQKETRPTLKSILDSIEGTGKILLDIAVVTALAGLGHRRVPTFRPDVQAGAAAGQHGRRQYHNSLDPYGCSIDHSRNVAADDGGLHHACGAGRPSAGTSRHPSAGRAPFLLLLRHAVADYSARLHRDLRGGVDCARRLLEIRLDRHETRASSLTSFPLFLSFIRRCSSKAR